MKAKVDYNELMNFKKEIEELYTFFISIHGKILKLIEDAECVDDDKVEEFYSYTKLYESKIESLKSDFYELSSEHKKLESCLNQTKLLKKRRVTKLESQMKNKNNFEENSESSFDVDDCFNLD